MKASDYNQAELIAGRLTIQHITDLVRFYQLAAGLDADGKFGPKTRAALEPYNPREDLGKRFLFEPLPRLPDGRLPLITSGYRTKDRPNHNGTDWFYNYRPGDQPNFVGDKGGAGRVEGQPTPRWVVPYGTYAVAAAGGKVQIAGNSPTGYRMWIDHGDGLRTGYFHLLNLLVAVGDVVTPGKLLGLVGDNPADHDGRHLHFELSPVDVYRPLDPEDYIL